MTNHFQTKQLQDYIKSKEFERLVTLRRKYKELNELAELERNAKFVIENYNDPIDKLRRQIIIQTLGKE